MSWSLGTLSSAGAEATFYGKHFVPSGLNPECRCLTTSLLMNGLQRRIVLCQYHPLAQVVLTVYKLAACVLRARN
ncbi:MAG: hypothetical protein JWM21_4427 [Acidobacteria bacterium]|nr:hypothetical protein [Acidobacteriota bacterium]